MTHFSATMLANQSDDFIQAAPCWRWPSESAAYIRTSLSTEKPERVHVRSFCARSFVIASSSTRYESLSGEPQLTRQRSGQGTPRSEWTHSPSREA
jgi:hypothetical protein